MKLIIILITFITLTLGIYSESVTSVDLNTMIDHAHHHSKDNHHSDEHQTEDNHVHFHCSNFCFALISSNSVSLYQVSPMKITLEYIYQTLPTKEFSELLDRPPIV